jgi:hypothetical protein
MSPRRRREAYEIMPSGEEQSLFLAVLSYPTDPARRDAYRAWLAARGDGRAELLALEEELLGAPAPGAAAGASLAAKRARVRELLADDDTWAWWTFVARTAPIRNCGEGDSARPRVRFRLLCTRSWEDLEPTADARVRRCSTCEHDVYHCETQDEAAEHARRGHCITVPARIAAVAGQSSSYTGRPDRLDIWGRDVFGPAWED